MYGARTDAALWRRWSVAIVAMLVSLAALPVHASPYPPSGRPWTNADYASFLKAVTTGQAPLPLLGDPATKAVFERLVARDNIALVVARNKSLPLTKRLEEIGGAQGGLAAAIVLYTAELAKGKPYGREMAKLHVYQMEVLAAMSRLADELVPQIPRDNAYQSRMEGVNAMRLAFRMIVYTSVMALARTDRYSSESKLEIGEGTVKYLPAFQSALSDGDRTKLAGSIRTQLAATSDTKLKAALTELLAGVAAKSGG